MTVPYKVEPGDYWHYTKYNAITYPRGAMRWILRLAGIPLLFSIALWFPLADNPILRGYLIILFTLIWMGSRFSYYRQKVLATKTDSATFSLSIDTNGLWFHGNHTKSWIPWRALSDISQNSRHIYLFHRGASAWIVAKRNFDSPADAERFYETARSYWSEGQKADMSAYNPFREEEEADPQRVEVAYDYTLKDYIHYARKYFLTHRIAKGIGWGFVALVSIAFGLYLLLDARIHWALHDQFFVTFLTLGLFFTGMGCLYIWWITPWAYTLAITRAAREDKAIVGPRRAVLTKRGIIDWTPYRASWQDWSGITKILDDEYILLYTSSDAYTVPQFAFETPEKAIAFLHAARDLWNRAQPLDHPDRPVSKNSWPPAPKGTG